MFDVELLKLLNSLAGKSEWFDALAVFFAVWLGWWMVAGAVVFLAVPLWKKTRSLAEQTKKALVIFGSALAARFFVVEAIRFFYNRPRPFVMLEGVHVLRYQLFDQFNTVDRSFPSGHAALFFALAAGVFLYDRRWGIVFFLAALLISASRVVAGVHWPSDIAVGAVLGSFFAWVAHRIFQKKF